MFKTFQGVTEDSSAEIYLRPETAQGIFVNFNIQDKSILYNKYCKIIDWPRSLASFFDRRCVWRKPKKLTPRMYKKALHNVTESCLKKKFVKHIQF